MKALVQRVLRGCVSANGESVGCIGAGLVILLGVRREDTLPDALHLAHKTLHLRIFADQQRRMNRSILDTGGAVLVISQFTLYADTRKGHRPSFVDAAPPELAEPLYRAYADALRAELGRDRVATGRFGAAMTVEIVNDGPVTVELTTDRTGPQ